MVIKLIDIMTLNAAMVTRALDFVWMSYRGPHMLFGSLSEYSHRMSCHTAKLGNN